MMNVIRVLLATLLGLSTLCWAEGAKRVPTIDELQALRNAYNAQISPDGAWVAFQIRIPDLKQDAYVSHIWLASASSGRSIQLTRGDKSCSSPAWSPDGAWLAFTSDRSGDKEQIYVIRPDGGEAQVLTKAENGAGAFAWSQDGKRIAFLSSDAKEQEAKDRKEHLGDFEVVRREYAHQHLQVLEVAAALESPAAGTPVTQGRTFSIQDFSWSPDSTRIAFSATVNPDLANSGTADIYVVDVASKAVRKIVDTPGPDGNPQWSPDGKSLVFSSAMGNPRFFHANSRLAVVSAEGGAIRSLTDSFDEDPQLIAWSPGGIYFEAQQRTTSHLFRLDPATGAIERMSQPASLMGDSYTFSKDFRTVAFTASSPQDLSEVFISEVAAFSPRRLTPERPAQALSTGPAGGHHLEESGWHAHRRDPDSSGR